MRPIAISSLLLLGACAGKAQMPVNLSSATMGTDFESVPQYIEVFHENEGWLRVAVDAGEPKLMYLEEGQEINLVLAEVPRGEYSAIRIGTMTAAPDSVKRTVRTSAGMAGPTQTGPGLIQTATTIPASFCVKGDVDRNELELSMTQVAPTAQPTFTIIERPQC